MNKASGACCITEGCLPNKKQKKNVYQESVLCIGRLTSQLQKVVNSF